MGSCQMPANFSSSALPESSCGYLLQELKLIWDEVGQDQLERDRILLELEQECVQVYKRKVDSANIYRIRLHQALADAEAEFTNLLLSLGERSFTGRPEKVTGTLREQLELITPALQEMQMIKQERLTLFRDIQTQMQKITSEIAGNSGCSNIVLNENDLSLKKLAEFQNELQQLHSEKSDRLQKVEAYIKYVHELSATMGMDSSQIITSLDPSLNSQDGEKTRNISDAILDRLKNTVEQLKEEKQKRTEKLHRLWKTLTNLWNLMDTPLEDQKPFAHLTMFASSPSGCEISSPRSLTLDIIYQVEVEVGRLDQLKASKMKELFLSKQIELDEISKKSHMATASQAEMDNILNLITSGQIDHEDLLNRIEEHILKAKEEAYSRKDIMEKVEKWLISCNEERWLEEYSQDQNRYSVSRGGHRNLKRAERARITINKIPASVELLMAKTKAWENERNKVFLYDQVPLLAMLEEYILLRKEKEDEKYRQRVSSNFTHQKGEARNANRRNIRKENGYKVRSQLSGKVCLVQGQTQALAAR
ncbi:65-kDa microtubule-associated protein 8 isoform X2 [Asparagus officinalis]|uniref:65-kDa microtubule-associated protein 8 isoform X2 n=1 Tax=Asparagus officinalis TaxID=4686 RepID=UPI00098E243C|nr:65-kDa microtubule-associated protein 8 isoform X2 [Asparagus officinalis]